MDNAWRALLYRRASSKNMGSAITEFQETAWNCAHALGRQRHEENHVAEFSSLGRVRASLAHSAVSSGFNISDLIGSVWLGLTVTSPRVPEAVMSGDLSATMRQRWVVRGDLSAVLA